MQELPIYEPGLDDVVKAARGRNLFFSTDTHKHVAEGDIIFVRYCFPPPLSLPVLDVAGSEAMLISLTEVRKLQSSPWLLVDFSILSLSPLCSTAAGWRKRDETANMASDICDPLCRVTTCVTPVRIPIWPAV